MTILSKTAGSLSVISAIIDIHKTSKIYMQKEKQKVSSDMYIARSIGSQKSNNLSYKDAKRKNWFMQRDFFLSYNEMVGSIKGYFKGVKEGVSRYLPKFICAALAIIPNKNFKILPNIGAAALGALEIYDYAVNGTNLTERTDILK